MSEQFYNYISTTIIDFFKSINIEGGERFNLYIENEKSVYSLYNNLKDLFSENVNSFIYKHDQGTDSFTSYSIAISSNHEVIIVASGDSVKEDFITTLRNKVAKQEGVFKNKSLLILFSGKLDSLIGGSDSLLKKGMPLNGKVFSNKIRNSINESSNLKTHEKTILEFHLEKIINNSKLDNQSVFDYQGIVSSIYEGTINIESYSVIGMFPHKELGTISDEKVLIHHIENNNRAFEQVEFTFNHGDPLLDLDNLISEKGVKELNASENWQKIDFSSINKWQEELNNSSPIEFIGEIPYDCVPNGVTIFGRTDGQGAKKRRLNLLVFNPMEVYPISLSLKFSKRVIKDSVKTDKNSKSLKYDTHGHHINLTLEEGQDNYYWLQYYDNESKRNFKFKILVFNFSSNYLDTIKRHFTINQDLPHPIELILSDKEFIFNSGIDNEQNEEILEPNLCVNIESSLNSVDLKIKDEYDDEVIPFSIKIENLTPIKFNLLRDKPVLQPITGSKIWKLKRERSKSFKYLKEVVKDKEIIKIISESEEYTISGDLRLKLEWEHQIIQSKAFSWEIDINGQLLPVKLENLNVEVKNAFEYLCNLYHDSNSIPSLTPLENEFLDASKKFVEEYLLYIESLTNNIAITQELNELFLIGLVVENNDHKDIYLSPLHPMILAYQIGLNEVIGDEELYNAILSKLTPLNLLPYINWKNNAIYSPTEDSSVPEWVKYNNKKEFKKGISKEFVRKLVNDKLNEFIKHFSYLFIVPKSPIIINVFNMGDCKEILQGLFDFYQKILKDDRRLDSVPCLDVNIYGSDKWVTKFEELTFYQNAKELNDKDEDLNLKISKSSKYDADDLLNLFRQNVHFYNKSIESVNYAHISFFHFNQAEIEYDDHIMDDVPSGMAIDGLFSDLTSAYNNNSYRTGFSTEGIKKDKSLLEKVAIASNSLGRVLYSTKLYEKDKSICSIIDFSIKESLNDIYKNSQWVTFIEPKVGLNFFKENEKVIIIHYSDQYNNTSGYDAITVTKKTTQYRHIIEEFLLSKSIVVNEDDTTQVINLFNSINGDWLLKMISQKNENFKNEKLSLLSASKLSLALFKHQDIIWIPTSLEEILRVSGNAGLKQSDSVFSAKNLGKSGVHSDDLLLIGLQKKNEKLEMILYPIEVKIGQNPEHVIKKAKEQVSNTTKLINEAFFNENKNTFKEKLYKNFFAKLALITAEKLKLYNVSESNSADWERVLTEFRNDLLNNNFELSNLNDCIGKSCVLAFGGSFTRKVEKDNEILIFHFLENDGYEFLLKDVPYLFEILVKQDNSLNADLLLWNCKPSKNKTKEVIEVKSIEEKITKTPSSFSIEDENKNKESEILDERPIRIEFGSNINNSEKVYWHPTSTNKVLHTNTGIIGTMGTGKTQFTKSLITQLVREQTYNVEKEPIGILIFDYKGDYIGDDFVKATSAKVFDLFHLPYNPLAIDVSEHSMNLLPLHIASTIKETISQAYSLGKKQEQALRDVIMTAYEEKGIHKAKRDSWSKLAPTISDVCELYLSDEKVAQDSLYAALDSLNEFEIFQPDSSKTQSLFDLLDGVVVINLSGYDESIQNLVVAITLDLFYSQMQKNGHSKIEGDLRQINKMILVDEADNFLGKNFKSIRKILKEGREFGVGTILSTQFLSHFSTGSNDYSSYILTWIVHRVNEIKQKEVDSLFKVNSGEAAELIKEIKSLEKHYSVVNLAGSKPLFIKDKAFWEIMKESTNI